jgi:hypothetical protein
VKESNGFIRQPTDKGTKVRKEEVLCLLCALCSLGAFARTAFALISIFSQVLLIGKPVPRLGCALHFPEI